MLHKAWNSKGEMPYCFPRSSIKFQGHTVLNITDFDPNWAFPDYRPVAAFKSLRFALFSSICFIAGRELQHWCAGLPIARSHDLALHDACTNSRNMFLSFIRSLRKSQAVLTTLHMKEAWIPPFHFIFTIGNDDGMCSYSVKICWQFAMPETCENCFGLVNICIYYTCQTNEI